MFYLSRRKYNREKCCLNCQKKLQINDSVQAVKKFCNHACSASFNNKHRTVSPDKIRRSRAEIFIHSKINENFPSLNIIPNDRKLCDGYEIDLLIKEIKLAIEINGPVHYSPIYGEEKFKKIQNSDAEKAMVLNQLKYDLITIDISTHKYWKISKIKLEEYYATCIKPIIEKLIFINLQSQPSTQVNQAAPKLEHHDNPQ
jgi:hypothetical protein